MAKFRYIGDHADTVFKGKEDGELKNVPVGPGDFITLDDKEAKLDANKGLFDHDLLLEVKDK